MHLPSPTNPHLQTNLPFSGQNTVFRVFQQSMFVSSDWSFLCKGTQSNDAINVTRLTLSLLNSINASVVTRCLLLWIDAD